MIYVAVIGGLLCLFILLLILYALTCDTMTFGSYFKIVLRMTPVWILFVVVSAMFCIQLTVYLSP